MRMDIANSVLEAVWGWKRRAIRDLIRTELECVSASWLPWIPRGILLRKLRLASSVIRLGGVASPLAKAFSISRPETPNTSLATL